MGTESDSMGLVFLDFDRAGATVGVATGVLAAGVEDTNVGGGFGASTGASTGSGVEFLPAGWLAAFSIRAAKSLESRFFFMESPFSMMV
jgi:hypothetical protein